LIELLPHADRSCRTRYATNSVGNTERDDMFARRQGVDKKFAARIEMLGAVVL